MSGDSDHIEKLEWIAHGLERGWAEPPVCSTHDTWLTEEEAELFWEGADPCIAVMRVHE